MWNVFSRTFVWCYLWFLYRFRKSKDSHKIPKPPFVIVSNHGTFFDPWIIGGFSRHPFAIMCNDEAFTRGAVSRWYLNSIGAFPKRKGASDFRAMKKTMSQLSEGYPVCIFPEGQTSWDGETQLIYKGIEKTIRRSNAGLVLARITGNFLTKPWWADFIRKGRIIVTFKALGPEQIKALSDDALFDMMRAFVEHNDIKDPSNTDALFSGRRLAEGLERFVWMCMECGAEDTLAMAGDEIRCGACGSSWTISATCKLSAKDGVTKCFADLYDWAQWHRERVIDKIKTSGAGAMLAKSDNAVMQAGDSNVLFSVAGKGSLSLIASALTFHPVNNGAAPLVFDVQRLETVVIQKKDIMEFFYDGKYYRFLFDHHSPMKWIFYLRYLKGYEKFEVQGFIG
jgi:1-acyl-sn-glycerol-3-phosphate acyltransferase